MTQYRKSPFKTSDLFLSGQKVYAKIAGSYFPITLAPPNAYVELEGGRLTWEGACYVQVADETPIVLDQTKYQRVSLHEAKKLVANGTQVFRYDHTGKTSLVEYTDLRNFKFDDYCSPILPNGYYYVALEDPKKPEPPKGRTTAEAFTHVLTTGQTLYGVVRDKKYQLQRVGVLIQCRQYVGVNTVVDADPPIDAIWFEKLEEPQLKPKPVSDHAIQGPEIPAMAEADVKESLAKMANIWPGKVNLTWDIGFLEFDPFVGLDSLEEVEKLLAEGKRVYARTPTSQTYNAITKVGDSYDVGNNSNKYAKLISAWFYYRERVKTYTTKEAINYVLDTGKDLYYRGLTLAANTQGVTCYDKTLTPQAIPLRKVWYEEPSLKPQPMKGSTLKELEEAIQKCRSTWIGNFDVSWTLTPEEG